VYGGSGVGGHDVYVVGLHQLPVNEDTKVADLGGVRYSASKNRSSVLYILIV